ncbi:TlpA family protein disulfide reductase [Pedobacter borealis]|uniref:TlpA family protein disulfide reductase n=1 Tax=Pedobacter borealis TaxID=475254 RepID=UPI0006922967|nr:TlpA disulfide reductase family protein [Pedobacter borealis]
MKKYLLILATLISFVTFSNAQQALKGMLRLKSDFNSLGLQPLKVVIKRYDLARLNGKIDTVIIKNQVFSYETELAEPLKLILDFYWKDKRLTSKSFWMTPGSYDITFGNDLIPKIPETHSEIALGITELDQHYNAFSKKAETLVSNVNYENQKIADVEKKIWQIKDSIDIALDRNVYLPAIKLNANSPVGLYALWQYADRPYGKPRIVTEPKEIDSLLNTLGLEIKALPSAEKLIDAILLGKQLKVGNMMKNVSLPDVTGKIYSINDFKGKYVLVDFWASWCTPCRAENPNLIKAFNKYKKSGFQIISITRDELSRKTDWLEAIKKDKVTTWTQLSDFKNIAQKIYNIETIPVNYLIDPKGMIVGRDLRGEDLEKELKKIFKY